MESRPYSLDRERLPQHVAIIMDGNGRWAQKQGRPREFGHRAGVKTVRAIVEETVRLGIPYLTLYTFSTENWRRPRQEISALMKLLQHSLIRELRTLTENDVSLRILGDVNAFSQRIRKALEATVRRTAAGKKLTLCLALNYGGRDELLQVVKSIASAALAGRLEPESISERDISERLFTVDMPDPDLVIRTSGEQRISNFLLWQIAYSELSFTPALWPDFSIQEYHRLLADFQSRNRRFGRSQ